MSTVTYHKPTLVRFGAFRELTKIGLINNSDGASILSVNSPGSNRSWDAGRHGHKAMEWEASLSNLTTS